MRLAARWCGGPNWGLATRSVLPARFSDVADERSGQWSGMVSPGWYVRGNTPHRWRAQAGTANGDATTVIMVAPPTRPAPRPVYQPAPWGSGIASGLASTACRCATCATAVAVAGSS